MDRSVRVENSLRARSHFYDSSSLFVFWWDIAGLPNTQLIIPLIIHNVGDYFEENIRFPQCARHGRYLPLRDILTRSWRHERYQKFKYKEIKRFGLTGI